MRPSCSGGVCWCPCAEAEAEAVIIVGVASITKAVSITKVGIVTEMVKGWVHTWASCRQVRSKLRRENEQ